MRDKPMGLDESELVAVLRRYWAVEASSAEYLPVGAGSYHWSVNGPDRTYADVRFGGDFDPVTASTPKQREILLEQVKAHVTAEFASRQRQRG